MDEEINVTDPLELTDEAPEEQEAEGPHPLNHPIWRCKGYEGGKRAHLALRWRGWRGRSKPKIDGARGRLADRIRPNGA